jgi:hypothetical protein
VVGYANAITFPPDFRWIVPGRCFCRVFKKGVLAHRQVLRGQNDLMLLKNSANGMRAALPEKMARLEAL